MIFLRLFRSYSEKQIQKISGLVNRILALDKTMTELTDEQLKAKTSEFKQRYQKGESLDDLLVEAFAVCREADWRVLKMKPFPTQIIGGIILHQGRIAEMKTGEGKTLVETLPAYLNALTGQGVHVVTVNDYLAKRDSEQMGKVYRFLGLSVGLIIHDIEAENRKAMYDADITYGTNNEFGFDYLRDNMAVSVDTVVQREHAFAIVDEVDSILIDEARTPLIISGQGKEASDLYRLADSFAKSLTAKKIKEFDRTRAQDDLSVDYLVDEKAKNVILTSRGIEKAEKAFGIENLADPENSELSHFINQAIRANGVMRKDIDYIIKDGEVVIVDEFTGRLMFGRRYNDGLHQAIEAKEDVKIANESNTLATITFQNFFRLYKKLSGMTGTALTEDAEFRHIYQLDVVAVPTNKPIQRVDYPDHVYATEKDKVSAIIKQVEECNKKGQPVLIGTVSIEKSEALSKKLKAVGIEHRVLNAKNHEEEAMIIAQAGRFGSVTIATNMAGRGTDILLGGNPEYHAMEELKELGVPEEVLVDAVGFAETQDESIVEVRAQYRILCEKYKTETKENQKDVLAAGGLFIIGTERHESRRIDNQLRGRAGRQGDPGESRFFLSMEDPLIRLFIPNDSVRKTITSGLDEGEPIETKLLTKAIESAQKQQEGRNFEVRKNVIQYDDVLNEQREEIYRARRSILQKEDLQKTIQDMIESLASYSVNAVCGEKSYDFEHFPFDDLADKPICFLIPPEELTADSEWTKKIIKKPNRDCRAEFILCLSTLGKQKYREKKEVIDPDIMRDLERFMFLRVIDQHWMKHINDMTKLKDGINLQSYGQHDPVVSYKEQALEMYEDMISSIKLMTIISICKYQPVPIISEDPKQTEEG